MAQSVLEHRLTTVAGRLHRLRMLRRQTACWLLVLVPAIALCLMLPTSGLPLKRESLTLIAACALALALARWRRSVPGWLETARLVEQQNPALNDIVLTAVRQQADDQQVSPVLAQRVLNEADRVALVADWTSVVPGRQLVLWFLASLTSFGLLVSAVIGAGRIVPAPSHSVIPPSIESDASANAASVAVEPGDTEVERGTGVTIVARFSGPLPTRAAVLFRPHTPTASAADETSSEPPAASDNVERHDMDLTVDEGVFMVRLPEVNQDGTYAVVYGDDTTNLDDEPASSESYQISTFVRPRVIRVDAAVTPPEWSGRPPSSIEDTLRVAAIEGSLVDLQIHVNKPIDECRLIADDADPVALSESATTPLILVASVTATNDTELEVVLQDEQGRSPREETQIRIRVIRNLPPIIRIRFPQPDLSVSALQEVLTEAEASDDFGLVDFGITWSLSGQPAATLSLDDSTAEDNLSASLTHTIALEQLNAAPNDLLTWHFYADTYGTDGQVHRTLSDLMFADVRRFEEIFRESQQQGEGGQGQGGGPSADLLQIQRQIAIAIWNLQRESPGDSAEDYKTAGENVSTILQSQQNAQELLQKIRESAPVDGDIADAATEADDYMLDVIESLMSWTAGSPEPALTDASAGAQGAFRQLLRLRAAEHDVMRSQSQQGGGGGQNSATQRQLDQLELDNDRNRYETEQQAQQDQRTDEQREQLQILNRLKELARRQNMLNERLKQLESELRQADSDQERERIERELKRLREEQQDLLRDVDEVRERMDQSPSRNTPEQQQLQSEVEQARQNVRNTSRALDDGQLAEALSEGTRAERRFEELQDQMRQQTSSAFSDATRDLRRKARELSQQQEEIRRLLPGNQPPASAAPTSEDGPPSLRDEQPDEQIQQQLAEQREDLQQILEQSRELIEQSESSEPLLARRLYEATRRVQEMRVDEALQAAEFLAGRGLWNQVTDPERAARRGIDEFREGVEQAAEAVLGSEAEALRQAQKTLEQLSEELSEEVAEATGRQQAHQTARDDQPQSSADGETSDDASRQSSHSEPSSQQRAGESDQQADQSSPDGSPQQNSSPSDQSQSNSPQNSEASRSPDSPPSSPGDQASDSSSGSPSGDSQARSRRSVLQSGGRESGGTGGVVHRPLTGRDFLDWSDRLRDVEEILEDPELRQRVAQVRDRARALRRDYQRHGQEPQWDLVESDLLSELQRLHRRLTQDIAALQSDRSLVPIDREPVPEEFDELVQRYYELLGQERQETSP